MTRTITAGIAAGLAAAIINSIIYAIAHAAGAAMTAGFGGPIITVAGFMPALASFVPLLIAAVIVWLIERKAPKVHTPLAWIGLVVGVLSAVAPLTAATDAGTMWGLAAMHCIVGISWCAAQLWAKPQRT
ncbi:DUF6069 family protein [Brevibacterium sp. 50QC2O2]|jgi:hypothetical protein|uniref:DUF6069 family protein n=1 Tax=Brevibacterium sp. 50QC2O2 TaxID=2968459 RepID=UPI00211C8FCE|nr:DUF6069 family protein [Brevibacterium sp. 50QC2O2]MCQ9389440.1 DUF6069 family protein [Brevibacterium sp. 50QC2O2]